MNENAPINRPQELIHVLRTVLNFPPRAPMELFAEQAGLQDVNTTIAMPNSLLINATYTKEDGITKGRLLHVHLSLIEQLRAM